MSTAPRSDRRPGQPHRASPARVPLLTRTEPYAIAAIALLSLTAIGLSMRTARPGGVPPGPTVPPRNMPAQREGEQPVTGQTSDVALPATRVAADALMLTLENAHGLRPLTPEQVKTLLAAAAPHDIDERAFVWKKNKSVLLFPLTPGTPTDDAAATAPSWPRIALASKVLPADVESFGQLVDGEFRRLDDAFELAGVRREQDQMTFTPAMVLTRPDIAFALRMNSGDKSPLLHAEDATTPSASTMPAGR